jgi:hypothetical protein
MSTTRWPPGADGRRHRLLDQVDGPGAGLHGGLAHRALLDLGDARAHADADARPEQPAAGLDARDEVLEHRLRDVEVRDHAVAERSHDLDVGGRAAQHGLGGLPDGEHVPAVAVEGNDGRLGEDDALAPHVQHGVGSAQVDADVVGEPGRRQTKLHQHSSRPMGPVHAQDRGTVSSRRR